MTRRNIASTSIWLAITLLLDCSTNSNIASGTAVGNPGITQVSIIADEGADTITLEKGPLNRKEIPSVDKGGLLFTVTSISINVQYFNFVTANNLEKEREKVLSPKQILKTREVRLEGPFLFDVISGSPTPAINDFVLPAGKYAEMKCYISNKDNPVAPYAFELSGYFNYKSKKRNFRFRLKRKELAAYKYKGPAFNIEGDDSTQFTLVLNADRWLKKVDIRASLEQNIVSLDQKGNLVIDKGAMSDQATNLKKKITHSIIKSGYLLITSLN